MKASKYVLVFMMAVCLIFVSCKEGSTLEGLENTGNVQPEESEVWSEKLISLEQMGDDFKRIVLENNTPPMVYLSQEFEGGNKRWNVQQWLDTEETGESWAGTPMPWQEDMEKKNLSSYEYAFPSVHADGKYYFLNVTTKPNDRSVKYNLYRMNEEGVFEDLKIKNSLFVPNKNKPDEGYLSFHVLSDGTAVFYYLSGKMVRYDLNTQKKLMEYENLTADNIKMDEMYYIEDYIYVPNKALDKIIVYDLKGNRTVEEIDFKIPEYGGESTWGNIAFCTDEEGILYIATKDGIYRKDKDLDEPEQIISSEDCTVYVTNSMENVSILQMNMNNNKLYVHYMTMPQEKDQLFQYFIVDK
ncbi:MAG: hypothetical protein LBR68_02050 [Lachnoclostridium sp.]|nr:hypothetical protein [Lachnoclostridium sp.]